MDDIRITSHRGFSKAAFDSHPLKRDGPAEKGPLWYYQKTGKIIVVTGIYD
jgi:hypothetical protein